MNKYLTFIIPIIFLYVSAFGQNEYSFTMDEAVTFALENNKNSINAEKDILISQKEKWETIAIGLPQISSFFEFNNRIKDPISLIPAEFFGGKKGEFAEISFGTKQSISGELILNQLLFDGSYLIGLQSIELFLEITNQAKIKTDLEVKRQVINAYGNALVSSERVKILKKNLKNLQTTLSETKKIFDNGLTEIENVEQLTITTSSIKNSLVYAEKFEFLSLNILKLLLGIQLNNSLILKDNIETIAIRNIKPSLLEEDFNVLDNIDYKIALNSKERNETLLRLEKVKALPTLRAYLSGSYNGYNESFNITNPKQNWYGSSQLGINMSIPVFSSLKRTASTQKAKIELEKAKLNLKETENTLNLEVQKAKTDYDYSINNYETTLKNLSLAESIERKNQVKFYEGLASSFDLRQAQNQLYSIQNEYLEATLKIIENKINLEILLNKS
ncbi:MAG: TolC family protein [Flavobacteriaceae bacterium]|nr:TolC family protein [Flavobacteriaceae bacterium]MBL6685188.1 TolC family protein [Flavobacteriaceae bacterium]